MSSGTAVITVVHGRHEHLRRQREFLAACPPAGDTGPWHVVVSMADDGIAAVLAEHPDLPTELVAVDGGPAGLPVAAARNAGAAAALAAGADLLVFLDVDCLPAPDLLERYAAAAISRPDAVVCGPVTYLPPAPSDGWTAERLRAARAPHAARPDPAPGTLAPLPPELFWSLSFAVPARLWPALGGFYEGYVGYGGEDTDFAASVHARGVPILMAGGTDAYHQHHPVSVPPVEHLDDIVRNGAVYLRRHGALPMAGWLQAFTDAGRLTDEHPPRRVDAVRLATIPARHAYLDAVLPPTLGRVATDRVRGWDPDPLLTPVGVARWAGEIDVIHLHFGFDHLTPEAMAAWLAALREHRLPLVVTVHDLRNPHHDTRARHDEHLRALLAQADAVLTLSRGAADECAQRFGRRPEVVAHPTLLARVPPPTDRGERVVLVPIKALRRNVREPMPLLRAASAGAGVAGARLQVLVEPSVLDRPELAGLAELDAIDLDVSPYLPHDEVVARVAAAHAVLLPNRFGTHSGWIELARDLGTAIVAPDSGQHASQWDAVVTYGNNEDTGLDEDSLRGAVAAVGRRPAPPPASRVAREAQRDLVRARHDVLYRTLVSR